MSDTKSKRPTRGEVARPEKAVAEATPTSPEPVIADPIGVGPPAMAPRMSVTLDAAVPPAPEVAPPPAVAPTDSADASWTALAEAQTALARGFEAVAVEMTGLAGTGIAAAADAAIAMVAARTFAEAVEINAGLARRAVDAMIEGSTRLSAIGVTAVSEVSRPILHRLTGA